MVDQHEPTAASLRDVMSRFPTGVTVMTTRVEGVPHAMTANAVTSVSLDPLLVLVCVSHEAAMAGLVAAGGVFALTFLHARQASISDHFADPERSTGAEGFADVPTFDAVSGAPILADHLAWLDCRVEALHEAGDHVIVVGEVVALSPGGGGAPLVYHRSAYTTVVAG